MLLERPEVAGILVLHKALNILEAVKQSPLGIGITDLAYSLSMPKATTHRIVSTLVSRGYMVQTAEGMYKICRKMFAIPAFEETDQTLIRIAKPFLIQLSSQCQETVNLGLIDSAEIVVISTEQSPQAVRMYSKVGDRRYLHSTALGKVLLAGMSKDEVEGLIRLKGLPQVTPHTITSQAAFLEELETVRRQGYAIDDQENELQGRCIAAPIKDHNNVEIAALSISGPEFRMPMEKILLLAPLLIRTCQQIHETLVETTNLH